MYAQVAIPSYKGPNADSFTYEVPAGLMLLPGQLVVVPFGRNKTLGLITNIQSHATINGLNQYQIPNNQYYKIKQIDSVVFEQPFLLPHQLELLDWMAEYYLATRNNCAAAMLPELPGKFQISIFARKVFNFKFQISNTGQTLVLVPTINNIPQTMALFPKATNAVVYHSDLKPQEKLEAWLKVLSGQADFIFGTRQAIFFPFTKLRKIIILNEHDDAYKDQRSPYYDTLTVAEKICQITKAKLQIADIAPRVSTYFHHKDQVKILKRVQDDEGGIKTKIVSMINEKLGGNKTAISYDLELAIEETIKEKGKVLLYLNKKKESGTLYCNNCRYQEALPKEPEKCPSCGSPEIFFASLNIGSLATQLAKLFPKIGVNIIADSKNTKYKILNTKYQIDIATSAVFYQLLPKHYDLVAAVAIDSILNQPEFAAAEKAYTQIVSLRRLAARQFIVQTYQVDNPTLTNAVEGNYLQFYQLQIKERQAFSYPPYAILVKIVVEGAEEKAEELAEKLGQTTDHGLQTTVLGPFTPIFKKKKPTSHIIVKVPLKTGSLDEKEKALIQLKQSLGAAGAFKTAKQVIVDPLSLN